MKEETRMAYENKRAAHAVSGSTGGRAEQVLTGLVSTDSVQETGRFVKGGGLGYTQARRPALVIREAG